MKRYRTFKTPILQITQNAENKMQELIKQATGEIGWHGLVKHNVKENIYKIYDILVYPQEVTSASIIPDQKEFEKWIDQYRLDMDFPFEELRMHGHSHVNMQVFSSGIDDKFQEDLMANVKPGDYYIFLIRNKKGAIAIFLYDRIHEVVLDEKDVTVQIINDIEITTWAQKEIATNLTTPCKPKIQNYGEYLTPFPGTDKIKAQHVPTPDFFKKESTPKNMLSDEEFYKKYLEEDWEAIKNEFK